MTDISQNVLPPELEKKLSHCSRLPSLPSVALKIIDASKDPDIGLSEIAAIISGDPAISAKLLKIANSPLYSQRRTISNLREALTLLGFNAALTIALSFSLFTTLRHAQYSYENYWKRSILSAAIARLLGQQMGLSRLEDLFLAGLLQDIGILALESLSPSPYQQVNKDGIKHSERISLELNCLHTEHSYVGAWLLQSWNLPERIINAVLYSHSLNNHSAKQNTNLNRFHYCVSLSGNLADLWLEDMPDELIQSTKEAVQMFLGMDNNDINMLISNINSELQNISNLFEINLNDEIVRGQILDEAHEISLQRNLQIIKQAEENRRLIEGFETQVKNIKEESQQDHLTRIYNRKYIDRFLSEEFEHANINHWPLSLAFIDIDNFKEINDSYGHLAGDKVLTAIAEFFSSNIRQTDVLARYGGDEFILVLPGATSDIAEAMLSRLVSLLNKTLKIEFENKVIRTSVSIGLATHMDKHDFDTLKDFIRAADKALYKAKAAGRNCLATY